MNSIILQINLICFICIYVSNIFGHAQICTNDYFLSKSSSAKVFFFVFPCSLAIIIDELEHPRCLSSHGEFLGVLNSNFVILYLRDALQFVNSVVRLARFNRYSRYIGFKVL